MVTPKLRRDRRLWNRGKPTRRPPRRPRRDLDQASRPRARASSPELYASFELIAHHGAASSLTAFHSRRNAGKLQGAGPASSSAHAPAFSAGAPWRIANTASARRAASASITVASAQLQAKRAAPA